MSAPANIAEARALFKETVRFVEIEVFSYCNRRCWFCPNAHVDRISDNIQMPSEVYSSIIDQLVSVGYVGTISYSRYNEPLADRIILDRLREAHIKLPGARLHTNTNGDYLDADYLEELYDAGLRGLNIQLYLKNEDRYDHEKTRARGEHTIRRLGLRPENAVVDKAGEWLEYRFSHKDMPIRIYGRNFDLNGTSRGDQVDIHRTYERTSPCIAPFWTMYIDFNGKVMPCCNLRSDIPEHEPYIMGNLESDSIFAAFANEQSSSFRRSLLNAEVKEGLCRNCKFALEEVTEERLALMRDLIS